MLSSPGNFGADEKAVLAHLFRTPQQRVVWQFADGPSDDGFQTFPEAVFFRSLSRGLDLGGALRAIVFRRLQAGGWIVVAEPQQLRIPGQVEFALSSAAARRFAELDEWRGWLAAYDAAFGGAA